MTPINLEHGTPLSLDCSCAPSGIAFDGCHYYFTVPTECIIVKTDCSLQTICRIETCRKYDHICYDPIDCCFWASAHGCNSRIFKLDCELREIDCLRICCPGGDLITGLSFHCQCNAVAVSMASMALLVNKETGECLPIFAVCGQFITSILSLSPGYLITITGEYEQSLFILDAEGNVIKSYALPCSAFIQAILYNPCVKPCEKPVLEFLILNKGCYPYLCRVPLHTVPLGFHPCRCNDMVCKDCCHPQPHPHPNGCADLLESIALMETSLSHILNAEGEKLQKILAETNDVDTILLANREISQTVVHVTHLEQVLYAKLAAVQECCCPPERLCKPGEFECEHHCGHGCGPDCWPKC